MVIRELTYQLHKLEASESALVSADRHDKKSVLGIGGKNPDRSIPIFFFLLILICSIIYGIASQTCPGGPPALLLLYVSLI